MNPNIPKNATVLDIREIKKILPHRYPFMLVDRVIDLDLDKSTITAIKCVTINEAFFTGHFPDDPIMPGVLILEALAQVGGILIHQKGFKEPTAVLLNVNHARFRHLIVPGDVMYLHAHSTYLSSKGGKMFVKAMVNERLAAEAEIKFALRSSE